MEIPKDLRYTDKHEWARTEGSLVRIGITDYAQDALGDVVFVDLPKTGTEFQRGVQIGEVESTKSVSELYAPVGGVVVEVNAALVARPELLNSDPYGEGWLCVLEPSTGADLVQLLDSTQYETMTAEESST